MSMNPLGTDLHPWASRLTAAEQRIAALEAANRRLSSELSRLLALVAALKPTGLECVG